MIGSRKLTLGRRFMLLIGLFAAGFIACGTLSYRAIEELKVNGPVYERIVQGKDLIADILPPPEYIIESYLVSLQLLTAQDKAEQDALIERFKSLKNDYAERHTFWQKENLDPGLVEAFLQEADRPAQAFYEIAFRDFIPALQAGDKAAAETAMARMKTVYEEHRKAIDAVVTKTTARNEADEAMAKRRTNEVRLQLAIAFAISLAAVVIVSALTLRRLASSLGGEPEYAAEISRRIAGGDLTTAIALRQKDDHSLLHAMKNMQEVMGSITANIKASVDSIGSVSREIASGNGDLAGRTEEQARLLHESAAAMEELSTTVQNNAANSQQANELADHASQVALRGGEVVSEVIRTMNSIHASSKKIVDIISVIDGIAFQTNILALNASVEAARAGEQGRGFAVVASEVRNLAQRSASAAKEIKTLIGDSVSQVDTGSKLVDQAGTTMNEIVASVKRVTSIIGEITQASQEQSAGIEQTREAIGEMDIATEQNAKLVESVAASADNLLSQASSLAQLVSVFNTGSNGSTAGFTQHLPLAAVQAGTARLSPTRGSRPALTV